MDKAKAFGKRIRELRLKKPMSQRELAQKVAERLKEEDRRGFDFTYLSKIENGRLPPPSTPAILQLASVLEADSDELLALAGKAPPDVGEMLQKSEGARVFFRSAVSQDLTEDQWLELLRRIDKKS
jgi:HTH-type transcriptional regulator, competence development regulator